jgi:hypothetical protein
MLMTIVGSRASHATTVLNVAIVPHAIQLGQIDSVNITFAPDPAVGTLLVDVLSMGVPAQFAQAHIAGFALTCGSGNIVGGDSTFAFSDQGCARGDIVVQQHIYLYLQCFQEGTYTLRVLATHPLESTQTFTCSRNPLRTGPVPPISGNIPSWLLRLFEIFGRPIPDPNG